MKLKVLEENTREYTFDMVFKYFLNDSETGPTTRLICFYKDSIKDQFKTKFEQVRSSLKISIHVIGGIPSSKENT